MRGRKKKIEIAEACTKNSKTAFGAMREGRLMTLTLVVKIIFCNTITVGITPVFISQWMNGLPDDPKKIVADPLFVSPGSGGYALSSLDGYKLKPGSPCFGGAVYVKTEGSIHDFYGNPLVNGSTDIGVYEENKASRF